MRGWYSSALSIAVAALCCGPAAAGARVETGTAPTVGTSTRLDRHSTSPSMTVPVSEYVPTDYTRGMSVDGLTGYTLADLALANAHFKPSQVPWAIRTAWCESRNQDEKVGSAGERGRWQVNADVWLGLNGWPGDPVVREIVGRYGSVTPATLAIPEVNAQVASYIVNEFGRSPWSTSEGCPSWTD